jgi:hypothetical protein
MGVTIPLPLPRCKISECGDDKGGIKPVERWRKWV